MAVVLLSSGGAGLSGAGWPGVRAAESRLPFAISPVRDRPGAAVLAYGQARWVWLGDVG